jgi:hypothetical protein
LLTVWRAAAAVIGINFATVEQGEPTASYTSTVLGLTVTNWNYDGGPGGNDWSGNGTTFTANGATIGIWHDAANTWRNDTQPESSVLHGYLDDGNVNENYIHLTGLDGWLTATGATSYRLTVLRSTDFGTQFGAIDVTTGNVAGETGWLGNGTPTGGATNTLAGAIPGSGVIGSGALTFETQIFTGSANGLAFHYPAGSSGATRNTVAGIIIEAVPEPSVAALAGLAGLFLGMRRRRA